MGEVKNMFDLNKLHLEDELNEDVSFEEGLAEYVENTKDASIDTLAEEFKVFSMFKLYAGAVRGGADSETTTRLIGSMILGRSITDEKFRDRFYKPDLIDKDRTKDGDYYKKPTQYWFINFKPKDNLVFEPIDYVETKIISKSRVSDDGLSVKTQRSMIHPQYASRFIRQYLIDWKSD